MTVRKLSASFSLAAAAGIALSIGSAAAAKEKDVTVVAQVPADVLVERVSYADLDLASKAGVDRLNLRVRGAVRRVCAPHDQRHTFGDYSECRTFAIDGARPQMALAIARASQIAATGTSAIPPVAILIATPAR